jgi:hypothetical protein
MILTNNDLEVINNSLLELKRTVIKGTNVYNKINKVHNKIKGLSKQQKNTEYSEKHESKALHIVDVSKRFSFEQQKAVKYIVNELFAVLNGEYGVGIQQKIVEW